MNEDEFKSTKKLAEQGDASAQHNLGDMYYYGYGVVRNKKEAIKWFTLSAEQGFSEAQRYLGNMYYRGNGTARNKITAMTWWKRSARQGDEIAQYCINKALNN